MNRLIDGSVRLELESRGRWFEPLKKSLCCVLEKNIIICIIVLVQLEKRPDRVVKMLTGT